MLNGMPKKSRVTKRYAGKEQKEKCAEAIKVQARKEAQRKRDKILGAGLRKLFAEHASIETANLFIQYVLRSHPLASEKQTVVSVCGWGDDPRDWEIMVFTPEDRKIQEISNQFRDEIQRLPYGPDREEYCRRIRSELRDLQTKSEITKRSLGLLGNLKIRDLAKGFCKAT